MSTGDKDTSSEGGRSTEIATEPAGAMTLRESPVEGDRANEDGSPVNSNEAQRMDAVLRSLAKRRVPVPNSLEPGASCYAEHAPAPGRTEPALQGPVLVEPAATGDLETSDSRARTTVPRRRSYPRRLAGAVVALAALTACLVVGVMLAALRATAGASSSAAPSPLPPSPRLSGLTDEPSVATLPSPSTYAPPRTREASEAPAQASRNASPEPAALPRQGTHEAEAVAPARSLRMTPLHPTNTAAPGGAAAPPQATPAPDGHATLLATARHAADPSAVHPPFGSPGSTASTFPEPAGAPPPATASPPAPSEDKPIPLFDLLKTERGP